MSNPELDKYLAGNYFDQGRLPRETIKKNLATLAKKSFSPDKIEKAKEKLELNKAVKADADRFSKDIYRIGGVNDNAQLLDFDEGPAIRPASLRDDPVPTSPVPTAPIEAAPVEDERESFRDRIRKKRDERRAAREERRAGRRSDREARRNDPERSARRKMIMEAILKAGS